MFKKVSSFLMTDKRDQELMRRVNLLAQQENLKAGTAMRRFLDRHLPKAKRKSRRKAR